MYHHKLGREQTKWAVKNTNTLMKMVLIISYTFMTKTEYTFTSFSHFLYLNTNLVAW